MRWCDITPCPLDWVNHGERIPPEVLVAPNGHKTCQQRHCGTFTIWREAQVGQQLEASRFLPALPGLLEAYRLAGREVTPTSPVFLVTQGAGTRLTDRPASCAVVRGVLKKRAIAAALEDENFTGHSFRRGRMQDDEDGGIPAAVTQARCLGIGKATYALYTDRGRPTRRVGPTPPLAPPAPAGPLAGFSRFLEAFRGFTNG